MNNTFHYYFTYVCAREAGFEPEECLILAQSASIVDFAIFPLTIVDDRNNQREFSPTQNYGYSDQNALPIWYPFHYVPSLEQKTDLVRPSNRIARTLLVEALKSKDLFSIGIALHSYADTWSHQNFVGKLDKANSLLPNSPLPAVGHAQAGFAPDIYGLSWIDPRTPDQIISNQDRFSEATRVIYRFLAAYKGKNIVDINQDLDVFVELKNRTLAWENSVKYGGISKILSHQSLRLLIDARWTGPKDLQIIGVLGEKYKIPKFDKNLWGSFMPNQRVHFGSKLAKWAFASEVHRQRFTRLSIQQAS